MQIDWISRVREGTEPPLAAYRNRALGCGASVLRVAVRDAANAFDEPENLRDVRTAEAVNALLRRLIEAARDGNRALQARSFRM